MLCDLLVLVESSKYDLGLPLNLDTGYPQLREYYVINQFMQIFDVHNLDLAGLLYSEI